jgi:hypothetical protein
MTISPDPLHGRKTPLVCGALDFVKARQRSSGSLWRHGEVEREWVAARNKGE